MELIRGELTKSKKDLNETRGKLEDSEESLSRVSLKIGELQEESRSRGEELLPC